MMSSHSDNLQHKIQSLEHSLLFLQEQHTSTLTGLHEEISRLQQKCVALVYQLTQSGIYTEAIGTKTGSSLRDALEGKLKESQLEHARMKDSLEMKEERVLMLEAQWESKEQKYLTDMLHYQRKAEELQNELEHKSASIAYLTSKLHERKAKSSVSTNETATSGIQFSPSPPRGSPNRQHERKNIRCVVNSPAANVTGLVLESTCYPENATGYVLQKTITNARFPSRFKHSIADPARPAAGHSQSKRDRDMILFNKPKPSDYKDFININHSEETITKAIIEPLPPITSRSGNQMRQSGGSKTFCSKNKKAHSNTSGEIETVIVDSGLTSPERPYGKLQDLS